MKPGTVLGHEGVGVVEALGPMVRNLAVGDRVIIPSTPFWRRFQPIRSQTSPRLNL